MMVGKAYTATYDERDLYHNRHCPKLEHQKEETS